MEQPGARVGRSDCQTPRLVVRASRSKHWALYRSAGSRVGLAPCSSATREDALVYAGNSAPASTRSCWICAVASTRSSSESPFTTAKACPDCARTEASEIVVQVAFIEWTVHGKLRHPRLIGLRLARTRATSHGNSGDHDPEKARRSRAFQLSSRQLRSNAPTTCRRGTFPSRWASQPSAVAECSSRLRSDTR